MQRVDDPVAFLFELGHLHDATVVDATGHTDTQLVLSIDDLNWNVEGLTEYRGARPARLIFTGFSGPGETAADARGVWISEFTVATAGAGFTARLVASCGRTSTWSFDKLYVDDVAA